MTTPNRGKLVVFAIFALALVMAGFAWWWNRHQGQRAFEFWGPSVLEISSAETVLLIKLVPLSEVEPKTGEALRISSLGLSAAETKDISGVHGLVHARHAFLEDASYRWNEELPMTGGEWNYAVVFEGYHGRTTVLLDLAGGAVGSWEQKKALRLSPKTAAGWKLFIRRYFPDDGSLAPATTE
jgi:hypothetical protein